MSCCGGKGGSRWDAAAAAWKCADCGTVQSTNVDYTVIPSIPLFKPDYSKHVCECGSEKVFGPNTSHTPYCPKYKKV